MRRAGGIAAAAVVLHVGLGLLVGGEGALGVDRAAFDVLEPVRGEAALDVVRFLTDFGSFPVAASLVVLGAAYTLRAGDRATALGLVAGLIVLLVLVNLTKGLWERPRPADRFYEPGGLSYPSGHAAYATAWLAVAGVTGRRGLIAVATVVVIAVMASRLYLHVHYLTDVLGGAALGAAVFSLVRARS